MLLVPTKHITSAIFPGFISSTVRYNWTDVAPPNANTFAIHDVLIFCKTLTMVTPTIKWGEVPKSACCIVSAWLRTESLKHALKQALKIFFIWFFLGTSGIREIFFMGLFLTFELELCPDEAVATVLASDALVMLAESFTRPVSSIFQ